MGFTLHRDAETAGRKQAVHHHLDVTLVEDRLSLCYTILHVAPSGRIPHAHLPELSHFDTTKVDGTSRVSGC